MKSRRAVAATVVLAVFTAAGCKGTPDLPKTYTATGTISYEDGKPLSGGAIQFAPLTDLALTISGKIDSDGSFSLQTIKDGTAVVGAPEGEYQVTIIPSSTVNHFAVRPTTLAKTERVEARDNTYHIVIPRQEELRKAESVRLAGPDPP
jgi:hypothetical protein